MHIKRRLLSSVLSFAVIWWSAANTAEAQSGSWGPNKAKEDPKGQGLYRDPRRWEQLSGAARSALERKYDVQKSATTRVAISRPQAPEMVGTITNVLVNDPTADTTSLDTQNETSIALGTGSTVIAAFNDSGSRLLPGNHFTGYAVSTNGGASFIDKGGLPNSVEGDAGDPVLAHGLATGSIPDTIYLSTLGGSTFEMVQVFRSFDNGQTFTAPTNATPGFVGSGDFQDKPWIAVDNYTGIGQGNVYLTWRHFTNGFAGGTNLPGGGVPSGIRFTRSMDGGSSWGPNRGALIASEVAGSVQGAFVTVGPDHAVYVFWLDQSTGIGAPNSIQMRKSTDGGVSFGTNVIVATLNVTTDSGDLGLEFRTDCFPQAAVNPVNGHVYVVYGDDPPGADRGDVYFRQSTDGGTTWSSARRINDDTTPNDQYFPALAVTPNGLHLLVSFYDRRLSTNNTLIDTFGAIADIAGTNVTFAPNFRITTESFPPAFGQDSSVSPTYMGDYDTATADNSGFYYTWGDNRMGTPSNHLYQPDVRLARLAVSDLTLTLPLSAIEGAGLLLGAGTITVSPPSTADIIVALTSDDPLRVSAPAIVTIAAGQSSNTFAITVADDADLNGTRVATITASATNHGEVSTSMEIFDNETATLSVALQPTASEGDTVIAATVSVSAPVAADVRVGLSSSDTTEIQVPPFITIPAGQTSAEVSVSVMEDGEIDGDQPATITAHVMNWTDGSATITVHDNESRDLVLLLPTSAREADEVLPYAGLVRISGTLPADLPVSLVSDNVGKVWVPASVTIPAGQTLITFDVIIGDDFEVDGVKTATVTASAAGLNSGLAAMVVYDDESPAVPSEPFPPDLSSNNPVNVELSWKSIEGMTELIKNGGFESGSFSGWVRLPSGSGDFIINDGTVDPPSSDGPLPPYAGRYSALGQQSGPGIHAIYQEVTIPADGQSAFLSWAHRLRNFYTEWNSSQEIKVEIQDTNGNPLQLVFVSNPGDPLLGDWVTNSVDLSSFIGQTVRVAFTVNPGGFHLDVHLDQVSLKVGRTSPTTFDVYLGVNPSPGVAELQGSTTNTYWQLPALAPLTTYYWKIVGRREGTTEGPIWQFSTRGVDHFEWSTIASPQLVDHPFTATVTAKDEFNTTVSNFTGIVALSATRGAGSSTNTILEGVLPNNNGFGEFTIGYTFTPNTNLMVTHVRHYFGTKVSIWTEGGVLLVSQSVNSAEGSWLDTALPVPVPLLAGQQYRLGVYTRPGGGNLYGRFDGSGSFSNGTIDHDAYTTGDGFPGSVDGWRWMSVDIRYTVGTSEPATLTPASSGNFTNGAWTGDLTVHERADDVALRAEDDSGHAGRSKPFDVVLMDDLVLKVVNSPSPVAVGANLIYTLSVFNSGPSPANGVTLTNFLPLNASLVSFSSSQGSCSNVGGIIQCGLGSLAGGAGATVTVVVAPAAVGSVSNFAVVSRSGSDAFLPNNMVTTVTTVTPPSLAINNVSVAEGNVKTSVAVFPVVLSGTHPTVSVSYFTTDGTAVAGSDYIATNGVLTFSPSVSTQMVTVRVFGDTLVEGNETFYVNLTGAATNSVIGKGQGQGTIENDDGLPGRVDHFAWNTIASPQYVNVPFGVTVTAQDAFNTTVTNFASSVALSGNEGFGARTNRILGDVTAQNSNFGGYTLGYSFTPNTNLVVTHVRHYSGTKVSIWTEAGVLLASQSVASIPGTWQETPLSTPLLLSAGATYRVAFYADSYYWRSDLPFTFPDGAINRSYEIFGDAFPVNQDSTQWWFVDLRYTVGGARIPITPTNSANFSNGFWSGNLVVQAPASALLLRADDGDGHQGLGEKFPVLLHDDIGVTVRPSPEPVALGENVTYSIVVTNIGPSVATGVMLTNLLSASATFVSVTTSQGSCSTIGKTTICDLGTLAANTNVIVTVVATAGSLNPGTVASRASVGRAEPDVFPGNNSVTATSTVQRVTISIDSTSVVEGDSGSTNAVFTVQVSPVTSKIVSVNYATVDGTASAGTDYVATNDTLLFSPGEMSKTISVAVLGDIIWEYDESFMVNLSSPSNALLGVSVGTNTIIADDAFPTLSIADTVVLEGNTGTNSARFTVSLFPPSSLTVTVQYYTLDGTATAFSDYLSVPNGFLTFDPGVTNVTAAVTINGDTVDELDEVFYVNLYNGGNANIGRSQAMGTILNDDFLASMAGEIPELLTETCVNGAIDPNETVTMNFPLKNISIRASTTNLIAILLSSSDIMSLSLPQEYGSLAPGSPAVARPFTFIASGACGATIMANFQLKDGPSSLGVVSVPVQLGRGVSFSENFDSVTAPALPPGWTASSSGAGTVWRTVTDASDTPPNAVYVTDPFSNSDNQLTSPLIRISAASAQLGFRHSYSTESCCDHCWLEISINGGTFTEMVAAGGSFATNGYFGGGWSGFSGGFITTLVNLPASAVGNQVQLRWRLTSDGSVGSQGWYVDTISVMTGVDCCIADDLSVTVTNAPNPVPIGVDLTYTVKVANTGPSEATAIILSNALPARATLMAFSSSQGSCSSDSGVVQCALGDLAGGAEATVTIVVRPTSVGPLTNIAIVSRDGGDSYLPNNTAVTITPVTLASLSIGNVSVTEGDVGTASAVFPVVLSGTHSQNVTVSYATADGSAVAGGDYFQTNGTLTFGPSIYTQTVTVRVIGDIQVESNDSFVVNLSSPNNALIGQGQGIGTILNDDGLPGRVDHFVWDSIASPQFQDLPFVVTVTAQDAFNATVTNFAGTVALSGVQGSIGGLAGGGRNVLLCGTEMNSLIQGYLTALGHTSTIVSANAFGSVSFAGYDAIWLGAFTTFNGLAGRTSELTSFINKGGNIFVELSLNNPLSAFPFGSQLTETGAGGETVRIVKRTDPLSAGLTDAGLSGWAQSYHSTLSAIGQFSGVMDTGVSGSWVTATMASGAGHITFSGLDVSFHIKNGSGTTGPASPKGVLIDNALRLGPASQAAAITPTNSPNFSNGVWSGLVTVLTNGTNISLKADDRGGHVGSGNPFNVFVAGDLTLSLSDSPDPISTNSHLTYTLTVVNPGPSAATGVMISNLLASGVTFESATPSQGTCVNVGSVVNCDLGTLPAGSNTTVQIVVKTPSVFGNITDRAAVTQNELDPILTNNSAVAVTTVQNFPPVVSLISPVDGSSFQFPTNLPMVAAASDVDGFVSKVEFFNNGSKVGETTNTLYTFIWTNAPPGSGLLTAKATDNLGKTATSGPVNIYISPPPAGNGLGLYGEYFDNLDFTARTVTQVDPVVAFDLNNGNWPPSPVASTTYSVRWSGMVQPFFSDTYTFTTVSDDGVRLYVNGQLIINNFTDHTPVENSGTIALQAGQLYTIRMEYYQNIAGAVAYLGWSSTNQFTQIIPQTQLYPRPVIITQPLSRAVATGSNTAFTVTAGGAQSYQWRFNGTNIPGATATNLSLTNVQASAAGDYRVVVTNPYASVTSGVATLSIGVRPIITGDPTSQIVLSGTNVSFSVSASGSLPISYGWRKVGVPLLTNMVLNASNSVYTITNVQVTDAGTYRVGVTNLFGLANGRINGLSSNVSLSVVSSQIDNQVVNQGSNVTFEISADSPDLLTYKWGFNAPGTLPGATDSSLTLTNVQSTDEGNYYAVVTHTSGSVTTLVASLSVILRDTDQNGLPDDWEIARFGHLGVDPNADPDGDTMNNLQECIAGTDPLDASSYLKIDRIYSGLGATTLEFSAVSNKTYSLHYKESPDLGRWTKFAEVNARRSNHVERVVDPYPATATRLYRLATPKVPDPTNPPPAILSSPQSIRAGVGEDVAFNVFVVGTGLLNYQWMFNGTPLSSATTSNLALSNAQMADAGAYSVMVTDQRGSQTTDAAILGFWPLITAQPQSQSVALGSEATFRIDASGTAPLSYRWRRNGKNLPGRTNPVLTLSNLQPADAGDYSVFVGVPTPLGVLSTISSNATLTVLPAR